MSVTYDSTEVRRAARQIRASLDRLSQVQPRMRRLRADVSQEFEGATADAMSGRLSELDTDVNRMAAALNQLSKALNRFADELDAADAKIKSAL